MRTLSALAVTLVIAVTAAQPAAAYDVETYTVYCADDRIEISFWDLEQMKVRRGSDVCQFASFTSSSSAMDFAEDNFGGEDTDCTCGN